MPSFSYTARDSNGQSVKGIISAASVVEVGKLLRQEGKYPITVELSRFKGKSAQIGIKITRNEVIQLSTQLSVMVDTGVTIVEALECINKTVTKPKMKKLVEDIAMHIRGGGDLSGALAKHPRSFPVLYIALIKASEQTGMLSEMMNRATNYMREEAEIVRKVKGALTYPAIMFSFALLTTISMLIFVLPRFTSLYANKMAALPTPTKILMGISSTLINYWMLIVPSIALVVIGLFCVVKFTDKGLKIFHTIQIRLPLLGTMFRDLHLSRGLRMVGTMAGAGVGLVECVNTARNLCQNVHFQKLWSDIEQQIQLGKQLSEPMASSSLVPPSVAQMINSAERSGKLAEVMEQVAIYSEKELKERIAELTRYIEPAMIVLMGVLIGGISMAMLLPIFTISRVMSH